MYCCRVISFQGGCFLTSSWQHRCMFINIVRVVLYAWMFIIEDRIKVVTGLEFIWRRYWGIAKHCLNLLLKQKKGIYCRLLFLLRLYGYVHTYIIWCFTSHQTFSRLTIVTLMECLWYRNSSLWELIWAPYSSRRRNHKANLLTRNISNHLPLLTFFKTTYSTPYHFNVFSKLCWSTKKSDVDM